jgi:hypothetical protein
MIGATGGGAKMTGWKAGVGWITCTGHMTASTMKKIQSPYNSCQGSTAWNIDFDLNTAWKQST